MPMQNKPIMIMAGGTGGHVYPALAVADYLKQKGVPLLWLGTEHGLEASVVPEHGYKLLTINISGLRGKGLLKWVIAPVVICIALSQVIFILAKRKPAAVLGMGGFVSGPGGIAAWLMRVPLCIHEQNAIVGLTNRMLAPFAHTIMAAFPDAFQKSLNVVITGNPVRDEILNVNKSLSQTSIEHKHSLHLLVIGGSQGARKLNEIIPKSLSILKKNINLKVRHQTGIKFFEETELLYKRLNILVHLEPFINDMAEAYTWADIVVCRAGALTVSELAAVGVASILIPFPHAVDDHQTSNARYLSESGGAILFQQADLTEENLAQLLSELYQARDRIKQMSLNAKNKAKPKATQQVSELCMEAAYA